MKLNFNPDLNDVARLSDLVKPEDAYVGKNDSSLPVGYAIIELTNGTAVGALQFTDIDTENQKCCLGAILPDKRGYNKGFLTVLIKFLKVPFSRDINRVYARINANNTKSIRWCKYLGFQLEGRERQSVYINGKFYDIIIMSLLKDEFERKWAKWVG